MVLAPKWPFFQLFFLGNIGQEKVFNDILQQKNRLSKLQKQEVQKVEKMTFFQTAEPMVLAQNRSFF